MMTTILSLSVIGVILLYWLYKIVKGTLYNAYLEINEHRNPKGEIREATITASTVLKKENKAKVPIMNVELEFDNFLNCSIREKLRFGDAKPQLKRFEKGNKLNIMLDSTKKPRSPIHLMNASPHWITWVTFVHLSIITVYLAGCYYVVSKTITKFNNDFASLEASLSDYSIIGMAAVFFVFILLFKIFNRKGGLLQSDKAKSLDWDTKYYGLKALAKITEYRDTGTMINDNPVVKFLYTFQHENGKTISGDDTKVIGKLYIGKLDGMKEMSIMYLPDNPSVSRLEENLEIGDVGCVEMVVLALMFCFSVVLVSVFVGMVI